MNEKNKLIDNLKILLDQKHYFVNKDIQRKTYLNARVSTRKQKISLTNQVEQLKMGVYEWLSNSWSFFRINLGDFCRQQEKRGKNHNKRKKVFKSENICLEESISRNEIIYHGRRSLPLICL